MKPILEIQHISKKFMINREQLPYLNLRDSVTSFFKRPNRNKKEFWALDDISFNVNPGESVGIIGKNGAGKSTLLKILSKITPPTSGKIISRGRIASLLEVGTGFHSELSGRENVFMNGSILGMRRSEILKNFDAIVDFAGVEKFIDTSLKHYSSGMQLRLAFAVAAFLENEILIIDEVLAVGDAEFQKKCLGKMEDVSKNQGRTVLFVSHDLDSIESLCKTSILLKDGKVFVQDESTKVINKYLNSLETFNSVFLKPVQLSSHYILEEFLTYSKIKSSSPLKIKFKIKKININKSNFTDFCILFYNSRGLRVAIYDLRRHFTLFKETNGFVEFEFIIKNFNLIEGVYSIGVFFQDFEIRKDYYDLTSVHVTSCSDLNHSYGERYIGYVNLS
jgi:lipopolysaccharide transport system ATP-binding protein